MILTEIECCLRPLGIVLNELHLYNGARLVPKYDINHNIFLFLDFVHSLRTLMVEFMRFR
jgi:hypothetical protein